MLVWNKEDAAVAAAHSVDPDRWWTGFGHVLDRIGGRFARHEPRRHAAALMLGLLSDLDQKNCWSIAERRGAKTPDALQHLLSRSVWDADLIRDDLRGYVVEHLGHPDAVLVVDETGDLKKGVHSVGVQRQYTGTAGRIDNSQVAVYLAYASPTGHALIDRALYLPASWTDDPDRCTASGIPKDIGFATKPALATAMITAALDAGAPASWVAGDEVYGADPALRKTLEERGGRVRAGHRQQPARDHRERNLAGRYPGRRATRPVLATSVRRDRVPRAPDVLLGVDPDHHRHRARVVVGAPQRQHR